jgi:predicted dehydrogenase
MSFKVCVVGCGEHSFYHHGPSYRKYALLNPDVALAACCDVNEDRARRFQAAYGFATCYSNLDEMLAKEVPDAVGLVAPVELTAMLAGDIMEKGFPLILEKPPGRTRAETAQLIEIAGRKAVPNRVAFNRRYAPLARKLKERLSASFRPEDIQNVSCEMFRYGRTDVDFSTTAIHVVDAVRFLASANYTSVRFSYHALPKAGAGVTNVFMECRLSSNASAFLNISPLTGVSVERVTVNLLDNTFFLQSPMWSTYDHPGRLVHLRKNEVAYEATGNEVSDGSEPFESMGIYYEIASFLDDVRTGRRPDGDLASTLQSVEIGECIKNRVSEYRAG